MPPLHLHDLGFRPDPPPCRFAWPHYLPRPFGFFCFLPVGCFPLFFAHFFFTCLPPLHSSLAFATVALCTHRLHSPRRALIAFMHSPRCALINSTLSFVTLCTHRFYSPRCALIASIRHAVHSSLSFAALCTHSIGVLGSTLPISCPYPGVYNMYAPYHK
jgi:hypothetical protein